MAKLTDYAENLLIDHMFRTATWAKPVARFIALIFANKGKWTANTAYALNDFIVPLAASNGRVYKCTTAGTSGVNNAAEPVWGTTDGGTTSDNTAVWTEQTTAFEAGSFPEVSGGAYARVARAPLDANWNATQGGATGVSSGTGGLTDNVADITFPAPTLDWGLIVGFFHSSASTGGNIDVYGVLAVPLTVNNGGAAPKFPIGDMDIIAA